MREVSIRASVYQYRGDAAAFEFRVFATELAEELGMSADELLQAIERDEVNCREIELGYGHFVAEIEILNRRCRLRIINPM